ncbi:hypothetical protein BJ508DRAFT_328196 [Ascobolus immersus RN42]|uniref:Uncharacterized protein n=1 Tax=Ascobolus immersus RN42 TaxID=1160509 RepID=A0A3N4I0I5_ASCIM|nr:hypothetical protein BJ508DRAFT_328196 [Ascobolus immersus RN42]
MSIHIHNTSGNGILPQATKDQPTSSTPTTNSGNVKARAPPADITPMEAFLRRTSVSTTGYTRMYRDVEVIPVLPFPAAGQTSEDYVHANRELLQRALGDNYLVCCHFWSPVEREKSLFVLEDYHRPRICSKLGIEDNENAVPVLKRLFCLDDDAEKDYISTSNFIPAYILAGTAFLYKDAYPLHHQLYVCAMGCDPAYHLQARFIVSLTPAVVHYPAPGALPPRITSNALPRNPKERIQGLIHFLDKKTFHPNAKSIKKGDLDDADLRRRFVNGLWYRCVELEARDVEEIDWKARDPEDLY